MIKPNKTPYKNQKEIHDKIILELKSKFTNNIKEAYLTGSLASGNFGIYKEEFDGFLGSDIDIVAIVDIVPKTWKYEGEFYDWHKKYFAGIIKIKNIEHPIKVMVPFDNHISLFWKKIKELNMKYEKLK